MSALTLAEGWVQGIRHVHSDNYSERPAAAEVRLAVIHGISLPPGEFGGEAVAQLFTNRLDCDAHPYYARLRDVRVSAHFFIRRDGELLQFVATQHAAWHAGESVWHGAAQCNDFSIGIELEGTDDAAYAAAQYGQLTRLLQLLVREHPQLAVAGHCHIAPQRKTDPGAAFDWHDLFSRIGAQHDGRHGHPAA